MNKKDQNRFAPLASNTSMGKMHRMFHQSKKLKTDMTREQYINFMMRVTDRVVDSTNPNIKLNTEEGRAQIRSISSADSFLELTLSQLGDIIENYNISESDAKRWVKELAKEYKLPGNLHQGDVRENLISFAERYKASKQHEPTFRNSSR